MQSRGDVIGCAAMADAADERYARIREILLAEWDPTDAARSEYAHGAYDAYIGPLWDLIESGAAEDRLVEFLYQREREIMCFPGLGKQRLYRVARKLLAVR